jgi:Rad3-related DNA helicase
MQSEIIEFLSSPVGVFFVASNVLLALVMAISGLFVLKNSSKTLESNSEATLLVIQQASKLADTANAALRELSINMVATIEETRLAITRHDGEADERHKQELIIQQQIADTLSRQTDALNMQSETINRQTELMSSQVAIMQDMSSSDQRVSETIETRIAPSIEALRKMMDQLMQRFENFSPEEIKQTLDTINQQLVELTALIERKDEGEANEQIHSSDTGGSDPAAGAAGGGDPGAGRDGCDASADRDGLTV